MGKFKNILIVSDLDGTFFSNKVENFNKNIEAVEKFKEQSGLFTFATGRDLNTFLEAVPDAGKITNVPVIVTNGAGLYDFKENKYIYDCAVENKKLLAEIVDTVLKVSPETGVRFSCDKNMIVPNFNETLRHDLRGLSLEKMRMIEMSVDELINSDIKIYKCVIVDTPENLADIRKICEHMDKNNELFWVKSYSHGLEAGNRKSTKGQAALRLKKYIGGARRLFAIGDYENDIEMLKAADIGAAPENALDMVKRAAKIITASCTDGALADLIDIIEREYISL